MSNLQANVPLVNTRFVDEQGNVTEAWFLFLIQLWRRTGGDAPAPANLTIADVLALEETFSPFQSIIGQDTLAGETTFGAVGPKDALGEMVFAPTQSAEMLDKTYSSPTDFTPGTTTTLTLPTTFSNAQQLWVFFDGVFQGEDQYSLSGTTLTFTSAIPVGTSKVYVKGLR